MKRGDAEGADEVAGRSPDFLKPIDMEGRGGRRIGKGPMMVVAGIGTVAASIIIYTMAVKQAQINGQNQPAQVEEKKANPGANRPAAQRSNIEILQEAPGDGIVPSGAGAVGPELVSSGLPEGEINAGVVNLQKASGAVGPDGGAYAVPAINTGGAPPVVQEVASPYAQQWADYRQQRASAHQARYEQARRSMAADVAIDMRRGERSAQASVPQSPVERMAETLARLAGAQSGAGSTQQQRVEPAESSRGKFMDSVAAAGGGSYSPARIEAARSAYELKEGTVIPAKLIAGVNSDLPGEVLAQVTRNVFDSSTGRYLLVPQGAKVVGTYNSNVSYGQRRVQIAWRRIIYPDGSSLDLGAMPGVDQAGYTGLKDKVDNHYGRIFGGAIAVSLFGAGVQLSQPQAANGENISAQQTIAAQLGQQLGTLGGDIARRGLSIQPTITARPGMRVQILLTADLALREWRPRGY